MSKKNNFSSALVNSLPDIASFKINEEIKEENIKSEQPKENNPEQVVKDPEIVDSAKNENSVVSEKQEVKPSGASTKEGLELLKIKNSGKRSHFTTTLSEEAQSNIKRLSLALEVNINDIVENCINAAYKSHEKEIQRLIRKNLL